MNTIPLVTVSVLLICGCICSPTNMLQEKPPANSTADAPSTSTTLQETTTTQTTATTLRPSTTTLKPTTTTAKPTTTTAAPTTTTEATTTTLAGGGKPCSTTADCGGERSYLKCNGNNVMTFTEKPYCRNSPEGSVCVASLKSTIYTACEDDEYCVNATCKWKTTSAGESKTTPTTTPTTLKFSFPKSTTTTDTIPAATTCMGRAAAGSARRSGDCESLPCGKVGGGRTYSCVFIPGEGDSGHCSCQ